jgi:hypothetical protein
VTDQLLKKLEQRVSRRGFLKGSALGIATVIGTAAFPVWSFAQSTQPPSDKDDPKNQHADQPPPTDKAGSENDSRKPDPNAPTDDESKVTRKDENGRDYRTWPQCGFNMYRQDRTWTCENCGYSYTE